MMVGDSNLQVILRFSVIILATYFNRVTVQNGMGVAAQLSVASLWNITDQELSAPLWNITDKEWSAPLWNITDKELSALLWNITDKELSAPLWNITDKELSAPLWNITDKELSAPLWNITDKELSAPLWNITDKELSAPLWNITDKELSAPLWNITDKELSAPLWNITDKELSAPLWNITDKELSAPLWNITDKELSAPLWNITDHDSLVPSWSNDNPLCFVSTNITNRTLLFQGRSIQTCSLQVTASPGTHIQLQIPGRNVSKEPAFFYTESYGNSEHCMNKYVVFNEQTEQCSSVLMYQSILITMQGNVNLQVSQVPILGNASKCVEEQNEVQGNEGISQISDCSNVRGYNDKLRCDPEITGICRIRFTQNCGAILGHREVVYDTCNYSQAQPYSVMMIYPVHTQALTLSDNNIVKIEVNAFQSLINLEYLDLHKNELRELDADLFLHLSLLKELYLDSNMLQRLPPNIFHTLTSLRYLNLDKNDLKELDADLFLPLSLLKDLWLNYNILQRLPSNIFQNLTNLQYLFLNKNELGELDTDMFLHLSMLKLLLLGNNKLKRLPPNIFHKLTSLESLYLHNNELRELDADLFLHLRLLKVLNLDGNMLQRLPQNIFHNLTSLESLFLDNNQLSELDADLFWHLSLLNQLTLDYNLLQNVSPNIFNNLTNLEILYLSHNKLSLLPDGIFQDLLNLLYLKLSWNHLTEMFKGLGHLGYNGSVTLTSGLFHDLKSLQGLELDNNNLVNLPTGILSKLNNLKTFSGNSNQLQTIEAEAFQGLWNLIYLQLSNNRLTQLDHDLFKYTVSLTFLDLSHNQLKTIPTIQHLTDLYFFDLTNNSLTWISHDSISSDSNSLNLFVNPQEVCECYVPNHVNCSAADDRSPYLTCDRLLSTKALVVVMWLLGLNAFGGNLFVLFWRHKGTQTNKTNSMLLQNLAASDLLMGIYMLITASADSYYGDNFPMQSETWRSGITCRIAGAMSITSSEASVFFVTLISIDRFISIRFPFSTHKLEYTTTRFITIVTWMIATVLGIVPSVLSGLSFEFYDNSHVCIGLPLALTKIYTVELSRAQLWIRFDSGFQMEIVDVFTTHEDGLVNGYYFSTAVFLGLNCVCYLIILGCYIQIVRDVGKSSKRAGRSQETKQQIRLTTKVTAIVATDFCCWFPIIILGILVQTRVIALPPSVYAWCVTFVLPINSAINPYLYTVAEIVSSYREKQSRKRHRQDIQLTRNISNLETSPSSGH